VLFTPKAVCLCGLPSVLLQTSFRGKISEGEVVCMQSPGGVYPKAGGVHIMVTYIYINFLLI
jgi:hypothetical protein